MKNLIYCLALLPGVLCAAPLPCPTASYSTYLTSNYSCTVAMFTISNFSFSSTALNANSTPFSASDFTASGYDQLYNGNNEFYYGIDYTGAPSQAVGQSVVTDIGLTITVTDGTNQLNAISLALQATAGAGGSVSLSDSGMSNSGTPYSILTTTSNPLAQQRVGPSSSITNNVVLTTVGPDSIQYFTIKVADLPNAAVPEPSTWLLFSFGVPAVGALVYRRKNLGAAV